MFHNTRYVYIDFYWNITRSVWNEICSSLYLWDISIAIRCFIVIR